MPFTSFPRMQSQKDKTKPLGFSISWDIKKKRRYYLMCILWELALLQYFPFRLKSQRNDEEERDEATNRAFVIEAVMIPD